MSDVKKQRDPEQIEEKTETTVVWENHRTSNSQKRQVVPFPMKEEATFQEWIVKQDQSIVKIRIVSSGFGVKRNSLSTNHMLFAA